MPRPASGSAGNFPRPVPLGRPAPAGCARRIFCRERSLAAQNRGRAGRAEPAGGLEKTVCSASRGGGGRWIAFAAGGPAVYGGGRRDSISYLHCIYIDTICNHKINLFACYWILG